MGKKYGFISDTSTRIWDSFFKRVVAEIPFNTEKCRLFQF